MCVSLLLHAKKRHVGVPLSRTTSIAVAATTSQAARPLLAHAPPTRTTSVAAMRTQAPASPALAALRRPTAAAAASSSQQRSPNN